MNVTLINPPFLFPRRGDAVLSHCLGLRGMSSLLRSRGHRVDLVDALLLGFEERREGAGGWLVGLPIDEIVRRVPEDAEIIGLGAPFSQSAPVVHALATRLKERRPEVPVVMGGVYPSTQPDFALGADVDAIVVGEGETALVELVEKGMGVRVPGVYRPAEDRGEAVVDSPRRRPRAPLVQDLDSLPAPDRDIPQFERYLSYSPRGVLGKTASIITSRGCPFDCEYCSIHPVYGRSFRARSPAHVLDEVECLVREHGVKAFEIEDDNFTYDRDRSVEILEGFVRLREQAARHVDRVPGNGDRPSGWDGGMTWRPPNGLRIDSLDEDLIKLMLRSGCTELVFGLEHGDARMLRIMGKRLDLEKAAETIELCVRLGVPRITLFYMVGYPGETREMFDTGLEYLKRIRRIGGPVNVSPNLTQPYPGTRLLERCREEGCDIDLSYLDPLDRPGVMSTRMVIGVTSRDLDEDEVRRRRELVMRLFGPAWKRVVKMGVPRRAMWRLGRVRPVAGRWKDR